MEEMVEYFQLQVQVGWGFQCGDGCWMKNCLGEEYVFDLDQGGQDMQGVDEGVGGYLVIFVGGCDEVCYYSCFVELLKIYLVMVCWWICFLLCVGFRNFMFSVEFKFQIQGVYICFFEVKELKFCYGQCLMIVEVVKVFGVIKEDEEGYCEGELVVVVVEVGIGIGKIVVYSLVVIVCVKVSGKCLVIVIVIVVLQEQIVYKDFFDLLCNSGLVFSFVLVKGCGCYLCLFKFDVLLQEGQVQSVMV